MAADDAGRDRVHHTSGSVAGLTFITSKLVRGNTPVNDEIFSNDI